MDNKTQNIILYSTLGVSIVGVCYVGFHYRNKLLTSMIDSENRKKIAELHPKYRNAFANFLTDLKLKGYTVLITSGYRSIEKQNQLHAENPSAALGGRSLHNFGLALDINIMKPSFIGMNTSDNLWKPIALIGKKNGLDWGGELFPSYSSGGGDRVHFQPNKMKMKGTELLALVNANKVDNKGYVKI